MPGGDRLVPRLELLLGCGRREQRSFSRRLSADPGMPGLRLELRVGASSQQLPPRAKQKYRFIGAGGWGLTSRMAKGEVVFPLLPRSHWDCREKSSSIPRIAVCVSQRALTPRSNPAANPQDLFALASVDSKTKPFLEGANLQPPWLAPDKVRHPGLREGWRPHTAATPGCSRCCARGRPRAFVCSGCDVAQ